MPLNPSATRRPYRTLGTVRLTLDRDRAGGEELDSPVFYHVFRAKHHLAIDRYHRDGNGMAYFAGRFAVRRDLTYAKSAPTFRVYHCVPHARHVKVNSEMVHGPMWDDIVAVAKVVYRTFSVL